MLFRDCRSGSCSKSLQLLVTKQMELKYVYSSISVVCKFSDSQQIFFFFFTIFYSKSPILRKHFQNLFRYLITKKDGVEEREIIGKESYKAKGRENSQASEKPKHEQESHSGSHAGLTWAYIFASLFTFPHSLYKLFYRHIKVISVQLNKFSQNELTSEIIIQTGKQDCTHSAVLPKGEL